MSSDNLSLEKLRIAERLQALETVLSNYTAVNELKMKQNSEMLDKLNHIIVGNGTPGLSEKVRVLEDSDKSRKIHVKIIYTAIVAGIVNLIFRIVK